MIRVATKDDFEIVKGFIPGLIKDSIYGKYFEGYELTQFMFAQYISNPTEKLCLVVGDNEGFVMFDLMTWPYSDKEIKIARISFIYINKESRKKGLMDEVLVAFEHWAKIVGATMCSVSVKVPKKGYVKAETVYIKEVE